MRGGFCICATDNRVNINDKLFLPTTNTTQLATTAMVQSAILASSGITASLPSQSGNAGKFLRTNGSTASWQQDNRTVMAPLTGGTLTNVENYYAIHSNAALTLPDLTGSESFGLLFPTNAQSVPTSVTTSDGCGYVAEATGANIFFVKDGEVHTPKPDCFLNGLTRQTVVQMLKDKGITVHERHIMPEELADFEQCWLTGTAAEVTPVGQIGDYTFEVGDITRDIAESYERLVRA